MEELNEPSTSHLIRRTFRWPTTARELTRAYLNAGQSRADGPDAHIALKALVSRIAAVSGNPRAACWRFVRLSGITTKRSYRPWTKPEQQRLLDLIASHSLDEVTILMRRSVTSVRCMLHRLGASACMGQDWFTKHALAEALHIRVDEVQKWIDRGWLKCRSVAPHGLKRQLIDADDFCEFCKQHRREIVGNRLNIDRLNFVQTFVFPPSHAELLPVRNAKKEEAAYDKQMKKETEWAQDREEELSAIA
jgi:hypothetical protein